MHKRVHVCIHQYSYAQVFVQSAVQRERRQRGPRVQTTQSRRGKSTEGCLCRLSVRGLVFQPLLPVLWLIPHPRDKITVSSKISIFTTYQYKDLSKLRGYITISVILPKMFVFPFLK